MTKVIKNIIQDFPEGILRRISEAAKKYNVQAYIVGGYIRDKLLGLENNDLDISVVGDATKFAEIIAKEFNTKLSAVYKKFGTALLNLENKYKIEFVSARRESYRSNSRKPDIEFADLESDLKRRDFTINALAVSLNEDDSKIIDLFGGLEDLDNKILRTPLNPDQTFKDDPLRIIRCIRFASQLNFEIHPDTYKAIIKFKELLIQYKDNDNIVSQERITDEFFKILESPKPSVGLILLEETGLMKIILPEISELEGVEQRKDFHHKDVFYHTIQVVDNVSKITDGKWLRFSALMHDIAKPQTKKFVEGIGWTFHGHEDLGAKMQKKIFKKLKLPMDKEPYVSKLVRLHLRPISLAEENVTDSAIRRLIFEAGDVLEDLFKLCRADITSKDQNKIKKYLGNFKRVEKRIIEVEERDKIRNFQSPVRGGEIMKICNLQPSKKVGIIKKKIEEAILDGIIPNNYNSALDYLYKIKDELIKSELE